MSGQPPVEVTVSIPWPQGCLVTKTLTEPGNYVTCYVGDDGEWRVESFIGRMDSDGTGRERVA